MLSMVAFGWTADRLGPHMSLLGMTAVFGVTASELRGYCGNSVIGNRKASCAAVLSKQN